MTCADGGLAPRVDWRRTDLDDQPDAIPGIASLVATYREALDPRLPIPYRAYLPLALFHLERWEEYDGGGYDWSEYTPRGAYPPVKVLIGARGRPKLYVRDGNHRLWYWRQQGFLLAPCWVLEYPVPVSLGYRQVAGRSP